MTSEPNIEKKTAPTGLRSWPIEEKLVVLFMVCAVAGISAMLAVSFTRGPDSSEADRSEVETVIETPPEPATRTAVLDPISAFRGGRATDAGGALVFDQNDARSFDVMPAGARFIFGHGQSRATLESSKLRAQESYFTLCLPDIDGSWISRPVFLKQFAEGSRGRVAWSEYEEMVEAVIAQDICGTLLDADGEMATPSIAETGPLN